MQGTPGAKRSLLVVLVIVAAFATATATAFLLGDQSESNPSLDRAVQPVELSRTMALLLGFGSLAVAAGVVALVIWRTRSRLSAGAWTLAVLSFIVAGVCVGFAYAMGTAQVTGANIGYGLVMLGAIPVVPAALVVGIIAIVSGWRKDREQMPPMPVATSAHLD